MLILIFLGDWFVSDVAVESIQETIEVVSAIKLWSWSLRHFLILNRNLSTPSTDLTFRRVWILVCQRVVMQTAHSTEDGHSQVGIISSERIVGVWWTSSSRVTWWTSAWWASAWT